MWSGGASPEPCASSSPEPRHSDFGGDRAGPDSLMGPLSRRLHAHVKLVGESHAPGPHAPFQSRSIDRPLRFDGRHRRRACLSEAATRAAPARPSYSFRFSIRRAFGRYAAFAFSRARPPAARSLRFFLRFFLDALPGRRGLAHPPAQTPPISALLIASSQRSAISLHPAADMREPITDGR